MQLPRSLEHPSGAPGESQPALTWRLQARVLEGQQGKAPMAKDLAFKDQGQRDEPDTWAPGSSQVLQGWGWGCKGLSVAMVEVLGPHLQSQMVYIRPGYITGNMSYRQAPQQLSYLFVTCHSSQE